MLLARLACFIAVFLCAGIACAQDQVQTLPVGNLEVLGIIDARGSMEERLLPQLEKRPELKQIFANGPLPGVSKTYFLKKDGHNILIDTGWGNELDQKGDTLSLLTEKGVKPADITDILLTHMDFDHIGGLLKGGQPVYPNAVIWIAKPELEAWSKGNVKSRPDFAKKLAQDVATVYKGKIKTFEPGEQILPGIRSVDASGHTPGHTAYEISSGRNKLLIIGDAIHVGQLQFAHPELSTIYDMNPEKSAKARVRVLNRAANDRSEIGGMHFEMVSPVRKRLDGGFAIREPR